MTTHSSNPAGRPLNRELVLSLIETAQFMGQIRFAREAALAWLAAYPGDLPINLRYARLMLKEDKAEQALAILERLTRSDPEDLEAARARLEAELKLQAHNEQRNKSKTVRRVTRTANLTDALGCVLALGGNLADTDETAIQRHAKDATTAVWSQQVRQARQALNLGALTAPKTAAILEQADQMLNPAIAANPPTPLVPATHLRLIKARGAPLQSLRTLAEFYQQRWPDCLQFQLLLADAWMNLGEPEKAVSLLHKAAANDVTGQVAARLWEGKNPYQVLWPSQLEINLDIPIPAAVAATLGWNQLPDGQNRLVSALFSPGLHLARRASAAAKGVAANISGQSQPSPEPPRPAPVVPETLVSIQSELEQIADRLNQPGLARSDGRYPVYVLLTTRQGLKTHYGAAGAAEIDSRLNRLAQVVPSRRGWRSLLFYADEGLMPDVRPARPADPWSIKLALADLDSILWRKGEMIGAVLIVGGPEIVPFHHLPNPVDDADDEVPSDNPYGTRDENYFIPEWPVGRLPGGASKDPAALLHLLDNLATRYQSASQRKAGQAWYRLWLENLFAWLRHSLTGGRSAASKRRSIGLTAAVWRSASQMVYRPIGEPRSLLVSPPLGLGSNGNGTLASARLGYFNLHGLADAVEWYGQSEPGEGDLSGANIRDYPVALRPQDVVNGGRAPEIVFSEACYGAHILGKEVEEALSLKFLQSGSQTVIGSTVTAYGAITTPLTAADFLGHAFWEEVRQGVPAGEALRRAKVALAREMHRRQGYLDGEDQKTLISFVHYGDPLAQPVEPGRLPKSILRPLKPPKGLKTVCERARPEDVTNPAPPEVTASVRKIVEQYLPGMQGARLDYCPVHTQCSGEGHTCPTAQLSPKSSPVQPADAQPDRSVVVLSKQVQMASHVHNLYARLTLDENNRLIKLVVSR